MQGSDLWRRGGVEGGLVAGFAAGGVGDVTGLGASPLLGNPRKISCTPFP